MVPKQLTLRALRLWRAHLRRSRVDIEPLPRIAYFEPRKTRILRVEQLLEPQTSRLEIPL